MNKLSSSEQVNSAEILAKLSRYQPENFPDQQNQLRIIDFIKNNPDCFKRELQIGHIAGSAWIVNQDKSKVLLTHHLKLNKWLQLGGHSDGNPDTLEVAYREAQEESGLKGLHSLTPEIFDLDVHIYPARQTKYGFEPDHFHYDIRFIFEANDQQEIVKQIEESKEVLWIPIEKIAEYTSEEAMLRMIRKTKLLKK